MWRNRWMRAAIPIGAAAVVAAVGYVGWRLLTDGSHPLAGILLAAGALSLIIFAMGVATGVVIVTPAPEGRHARRATAAHSAVASADPDTFDQITERLRDPAADTIADGPVTA